MSYIYRYENGRFSQFEKPVVGEQPLTIFVNGVELATFLCTPVKMADLTIGFLAFEGIIDSLDEVRDLDVDPENGVVEVELTGEWVKPQKRVFTSGCGMGLTFTLRISHYPHLNHDLTLRPEQIFPLMQQLFDGAAMYKASRGIHAAALKIWGKSPTRMGSPLPEPVSKSGRPMPSAVIITRATAGMYGLTRIFRAMVMIRRTPGALTVSAPFTPLPTRHQGHGCVRHIFTSQFQVRVSKRW